MKNRKEKFLVISSVGDTSLHSYWTNPAADKQFDLALIYYGNQKDKYKHDCEYYFERKGTKYRNVYYALNQMGKLVHEYEAIWIPDDDIFMNSTNIMKFFHIIKNYDLLLAQPSLSHDSYIGGWKVTKHQGDNILRYTNFVEIMAPGFSRLGLETCLETFQHSHSGFGLDFTWPRIMGLPKNKLAVVDAVLMRHTRPSKTGDLYPQLIENPITEGRRVCKRYGVNWDDCLIAETYGSVKA
jgi:hypothetical protein